MKRLTIWLALVCMLGLLPPPDVTAQETIVRDVVASGGGKATTASYQLRHTVGQAVINRITGPDYIHEQGFWYGPWFFATDVEEEEPIPKAYRLDQNYPNPFNPVTTISFALVKPSHVTLRIYDTAGRLISTVVDRGMDAGVHKVELSAGGFASGVYFYRLRAGGFTQTKKMILLR
ncbi:MAG: T9SS type A sorting domain-containing protein [bacterium]|nr:MAG: T9SS type A sorting domain-containing protein [bacterium]